jgi:hypothetical protein
MPPLKDIAPLQNTGKGYNLDSSGIAGFFGGDEAISAMATVHVYEGRKWLGWYNPPGSYLVARTYGRLADSKLWNALFPGVRSDPATLFGFDGRRGPEFFGSLSGTRLLDTGHTGYLFMKKCRFLTTKTVEGRVTSPCTVTITELESSPELEIDAPNPITWSQTLITCLCILSSVGACAICGMFEDWYCFSMILLGILSNGLSCFVIGSGILKFHHPNPAKDSRPGDGFLYGNSSEFAVVRGEERAVNSITRGRFSLEYAGDPAYTAIGIATMLLTAQFLLQLLLIPQGTLFGQIMFLSTLAISWAYNCYLSSLDQELIQADILAIKVLNNPPMTGFRLGTQTSAAVFVALTLQAPNPGDIFDQLLPDNETWRIWKRVVVEKMKRGEALSFNEVDFDGVVKEERSLLEIFFGDAADAYKGYLDYLNSKAMRVKEE